MPGYDGNTRACDGRAAGTGVHLCQLVAGRVVQLRRRRCNANGSRPSEGQRFDKCAISADGGYVAFYLDAEDTSWIHLLDTRSDKLVGELPDVGAAMAFSPVGPTLAFSGIPQSTLLQYFDSRGMELRDSESQPATPTVMLWDARNPNFITLRSRSHAIQGRLIRRQPSRSHRRAMAS